MALPYRPFSVFSALGTSLFLLLCRSCEDLHFTIVRSFSGENMTCKWIVMALHARRLVGVQSWRTSRWLELLLLGHTFIHQLRKARNVWKFVSEHSTRCYARGWQIFSTIMFSWKHLSCSGRQTVAAVDLTMIAPATHLLLNMRVFYASLRGTSIASESVLVWTSTPMRGFGSLDVVGILYLCRDHLFLPFRHVCRHFVVITVAVCDS